LQQTEMGPRAVMYFLVISTFLIPSISLSWDADVNWHGRALKQIHVNSIMLGFEPQQNSWPCFNTMPSSSSVFWKWSLRSSVSLQQRGELRSAGTAVSADECLLQTSRLDSTLSKRLSRKAPPFMEPEGSLPCPQDSITGPYAELDNLPHTIYKILLVGSRRFIYETSWYCACVFFSLSYKKHTVRFPFLFK
jgi:hypothetical protein